MDGGWTRYEGRKRRGEAGTRAELWRVCAMSVGAVAQCGVSERRAAAQEFMAVAKGRLLSPFSERPSMSDVWGRRCGGVGQRLRFAKQRAVVPSTDAQLILGRLTGRRS